ncbi:primase C-terminal domain-containing protein [Peribacillus sp. NJ11]|uniref:primase C-terminal domain-containing protein n=1 Tax=Peribacillus sp. NJ11 TaxID=3055861 RepID=UPI0025A2E084|nr:primase C-terminal domain-containing protein [Peribacillus sp. NJ11]MDM5224532.1 primase C-terminal domain-containing protein [Peribacillus sp. NJ11]
MGTPLAENHKRGLHSIVEIMRFMTHDGLLLYKKKGTRQPINRIVAYEKTMSESKNRKGVVFVSPSKAELVEGKGFVVTSYETLQEKYQNLSHWTPNTYRGGTYYDFKNRIIKGHQRENLKQIHVIGLDIDSKEVDLYALYLGCEELGLPRPNLLLETPRGFQVFFVLETPFHINKKHDYKALRVAERLSENIRKALKKYVPVDTGCIPFGFYRIPREDNVLDFYDRPANTSLLLTWSKQYEEQENRDFLRVVYNKNATAIDQTSSDWYRALIRATHIEEGHYASSRNNALMTLALANYTSDKTIEEAYDELDQFNSNLEQPLKKREFERILKSAYSGKYKGVKRSYVEDLLELWTDGQAKFKGREGWYKFKKPREERVRSHYKEWEEDIIAYLDTHTSPETPFLEASLKNLAEIFGMPLSTLKEVCKQSSKLKKFTIGRGRGAVTKLASRSMLFRSLLVLRRNHIRQAQLTFAELLPVPNQFTAALPLPTLEAELLTHEVDIIYSSGASPPDKLTS